MAMKSYPGSVLEVWADSSSPVSLTTASSHVWLDPFANEVELYCDVDFRLSLPPRLQQAIYDNTTTLANGTKELQDKDAAAGLTLNSMASTHAVYINTKESCLGFYINVGNVNGNPSVLSADYWQDDGTPAWADTGDTDGTDSAGATLAKDGLVYWSAKTDERATLGSTVGVTGYKDAGYWYRLTVSDTLDSAVTILEIMALSNKTTSQLSTFPMKAETVHSLPVNHNKVGGLDVNVASGTGTLTVGNIRYY